MNANVVVGKVRLVPNEQLPFGIPDKGRTVNAIHAIVDAPNLASVDLIISSAESDIGNCP